MMNREHMKTRLSASLLLAVCIIVAAACCPMSAAAEDASVLTSRAYEYYAQKDYSTALSIFAQVAEQYPNQFEGILALFYKGRCLEELGRIDEAVSAFSDLQQQYPHSYLSAKAAQSLQRITAGESVPTERQVPRAAPAAPAPAPARRTAVPADGSRHTVRRGETISGLALRYYGSERYWPALAYANQIADPARVSVGRVLAIPEKSAAEQLLSRADEHYRSGRAFDLQEPEPTSEPEPVLVTQPPAADELPSTPPEHSVAVETTIPPDDPIVRPTIELLEKGRGELLAGNYAVAESSLKQYLLQAPPRRTAQEATLYLAHAAYLQGKIDESQQYYQQAIIIEPGSELWAVAMYQLASLQLFQLQQPDAARATVTQMLTAEPSPEQERLFRQAEELLKMCPETDAPAEREVMSGLMFTAPAPPSPDSLMLNVIEAGPAVRDVEVPGSAWEPLPTEQPAAPASPAPAARPEFPVLAPLEGDAGIPLPRTSPLDDEVMAAVGGSTRERTPPDTAPTATRPQVTSQDASRAGRVQALLQEALELKNKGSRDAAEQRYRAALDLDPENPEVLNNLAFLYAENGTNLVEAEELVRRAMRNDSLRGGFYMDTLGWILYQRGDYAQASAALEKAVAYQNTAERHYHLGMVFKQQQKYNEAITEMMTAIQLAPDSATAQQAALVLQEINAAAAAAGQGQAR